MITALVLAAGRSARLGRPKQLLTLRGRPLVQHAVDAAASAGVQEIVVVLGHRAGDVAAALRLPSAGRIVVNPGYTEGLSSSLRVGLRAAAPASRAAVVLLGDQPEIPSNAIRAVIDAYERTGGPVVQASYGGRPGHPVLFDRRLWPALEALEGDRGARDLMARHPDRVVRVEVGGEPPADVDTREDYRRLLVRAGQEAGMGSDTMVGVVLGAGESSRFGAPKQLLPFGDTTLLGQVVRNANASGLDRVVVVLGRAADEVRRSVDPGRATVVDNVAYGTGCASSLLAGLDAAGECAAVMLLLGDQPGVRPEFVDRAIAEWRRTRPWAAVTSYRGTLGHPFVFAAAAFDDLRGLHGDKAVWKLIEAYPERVGRVEIDADLPPDVDTPEDYERAVVHWRAAAPRA